MQCLFKRVCVCVCLFMNEVKYRSNADCERSKRFLQPGQKVKLWPVVVKHSGYLSWSRVTVCACATVQYQADQHSFRCSRTDRETKPTDP